MADYKERFGKWQKDAKKKFEEVDKQLGLKEKIGRAENRDEEVRAEDPCATRV